MNSTYQGPLVETRTIYRCPYCRRVRYTKRGGEQHVRSCFESPCRVGMPGELFPEPHYASDCSDDDYPSDPPNTPEHLGYAAICDGRVWYELSQREYDCRGLSGYTMDNTGPHIGVCLIKPRDLAAHFQWHNTIDGRPRRTWDPIAQPDLMERGAE